MGSSSSSASSFVYFSVHFHLLYLFLLLIINPQISHSLITCSTQSLSKNKLFQQCTDLPRLNSHLHWTYTPKTSTLNLAFTASPPRPAGWVAWAINPTSTGMVGAQALIAYKLGNGSVTVNTFNVSSYKGIEASKIAFEVKEKEAVFVNGVIEMYATVVLPESLGTVVNQVWQVGGSVTDQGVPGVHEFKPENLNSKGKIDLVRGDGAVVIVPGESDSRLRKKNIHGVLNAVSWGILFPMGVIIARYLRTFKGADPAWFYIHVSCQVSAYALGVSGWATGLKLGSLSKGVQYTTHRNVGIALFSLATLQIFALFLRPKKEHKYRVYWNFYHHGVGYAILVLGIFNVFKGLKILDPGNQWVTAYITIISVLGGLSLLLEAVTWTMVLKRKSDKSTKPYDGPNSA